MLAQPKAKSIFNRQSASLFYILGDRMPLPSDSVILSAGESSRQPFPAYLIKFPEDAWASIQDAARGGGEVSISQNGSMVRPKCLLSYCLPKSQIDTTYPQSPISSLRSPSDRLFIRNPYSGHILKTDSLTPSNRIYQTYSTYLIGLISSSSGQATSAE